MNLRRRTAGLLLAIRSTAVYLTAEVGLRTLGLPRTCALLGVQPPETPGPEARRTFDTSTLTAREHRAARIARRVLRLPGVNGTCLRTALVLGRTLRAHDPQIVLGVRRDGDQIMAHAWLRIDGADLDPGNVAGQYLELDRPTGSAA